MDKNQSMQPPDTGKLTNFHYGSEKDDRTEEMKQKVRNRQQSK